MDGPDRKVEQVRRATTGRNVLTTLSWVFLVASCGFWGVLHWTSLVLSPADIPQAFVAVVLTLVYAFALPLLLSMLVPTTPAGMLLQKTQWRTWGFGLIIASSLFLCWHARTLMIIWFNSQPGIKELGRQSDYALACLIAFVAIPALAWVQATPEQWLNQIRQAHEVRKLELEQRGELAILEARILWAKQKALIGYANLLPAEREEAIGVVRGLFMSVADSQRKIAQTLGLKAEATRELGVLGDQEIVGSLEYVAQQLEKPARQLERVITVEAPGDTFDREVEALPMNRHGGASRFPAPGAGRGRQTAAVRRSLPQFAAEYTAARGSLPPIWSAAELGSKIGKSERSARDRIAAWEAAGLVGREPDGRGAFYFTESEAAR